MASIDKLNELSIECVECMLKVEAVEKQLKLYQDQLSEAKNNLIDEMDYQSKTAHVVKAGKDLFLLSLLPNGYGSNNIVCIEKLKGL